MSLELNQKIALAYEEVENCHSCFAETGSENDLAYLSDAVEELQQAISEKEKWFEDNEVEE